MAFNQKEQEIIRWSLANGKSKQDIADAITRFRTTGSPALPNATPSKPSGPIAAIKDIPSDVAEAFQGSVDAVSKGFDTADTARTQVEQETISPLAGTAKTIGGGLRAGAEVVGNAVVGLGKLFTSPKTEDDISSGVQSAAEKIVKTDPVQTLITKYNSLSPEQKAVVDGTLGTAEGLATMFGAGPGTKAVRTAVNASTKAAQAATEAAVPTVQKLAGAATDATVAAQKLVQSPIPKTVDVVLSETPTPKFDEYVNAARKATENIKNPTPLELVGKQAQTALEDIQTKLKAIGSQKGELMKSLGVEAFDGDGVVQFKQGLQSFINSKTATEGDIKLIRDIQSEFNKLGDTPSKGQVDRFIDFAQDKLYTASRDLTVPITDSSTAAIRTIVGRLNSSLKSQLTPEVRALNDRYSSLIDLRNELNIKLGKEGEKGGALMKRVFSPSDANTKKLFADILAETGIDLTNEAVLARYVMDILGDTRQKSMLEQLNLLNTSPTPSGITGRLIDYVIDRLNSPEQLIERARTKTVAPSASSKSTP